MKYLAFLDLNGAPITQNITSNTNKWKTPIGGLGTVILNTFSLFYLIYVLIQWQNGSILPKITEQSVANNFTSLTLENDFFSLCYWRKSEAQPDPFDPNNIILIPMLYQLENNYPQYQCHQNIYLFLQVNVLDQNLIVNVNQNEKFDTQREALLVITPCLESLLTDGQSCASQDAIDSFMSNYLNGFSLQIQLKQYQNQGVNSVKKEFYIFLQNNSMYNAQMMITKTKAYLDQGFLFQSKEEINYVSDVKFYQQAVNTKTLKGIIGYECIFGLFLRLDPIENRIEIEFPKLGEILAQVGSIVSLLMLTQHLFYFMNQMSLENYLIEQIISIYYPQFKNVKIQKNFIGKIQRVQYENLDQDIETFVKWFKNARQKAEAQLLFNNNIYQISRLQFLLFDNINRDPNLYSIKNKGFKMDCLCRNEQLINPDEKWENLHIGSIDMFTSLE